jgi:hypothetical protein
MKNSSIPIEDNKMTKESEAFNRNDDVVFSLLTDAEGIIYSKEVIHRDDFNLRQQEANNVFLPEGLQLKEVSREVYHSTKVTRNI